MGLFLSVPVLTGIVVIAATALLIFLVSTKRLRPAGADYDCQTTEDADGIRRAAHWSGSNGEVPLDFPKTLHGIMERGREISGDGPCLGYRPGKGTAYSWISYNQVAERCQNFGAGMIYLGLKPHGENFLGILAPTCPEWVIAEYSCYWYSLVLAPLYDSLGADARQMALNSLDVAVLVCGSEKYYRLLQSSKILSKALDTFIFMSDITPQLREELTTAGHRVFTLAEVERIGKDNPTKKAPPQPEDLAMLMFTSGTTGEPKAAMLTHRQIASSCEDFLLSALPIRFNSSVKVFAYLPLAHILERMTENFIMLHGGSIGFNSSGIAGMFEDMQELKPDILVVVPRILTKLHSKLWAMARNSQQMQWLLPIALWWKTQEMKLGIFRKSSLWDRLIFRELQDLLGGNVTLMATGSAPIDAVTLNNMRAALGCYIFEGYGQTESAGLLTLTLPADMEAGHIGIPTKNVEIKLVDIPELQYYAKDGKGEICARGRVFSGYYKKEEKTKETIDEEGWLHTGDVGQWLPSGRLKIIDRKKHIFKLSQGEYIAPEKIENTLDGASHLLEQIFVDGNSLHPFTVALVYPNYRAISKACNISIEEAQNPILARTKILEDLQKVGKPNGLHSFEVPKAIMILPEAFTLDNGLMTPTQKVKREEVRKRYKDDIDKLYKEVGDV